MVRHGRVLWAAGVLALAFLAPGAPRAQAAPAARTAPIASADDIAAFAAQIERPLQAARYLEGRCTPVPLAGWEGLDTRRCDYTVTDTKTGRSKDGRVILLDPTAARLSAWIVNACLAVRPAEPAAACRRRLYQRVLGQSGGQFPVAGIVYEDLLPRDGVQEAYGFANGVTTLLRDVAHRRTEPFSSQELDAGLTAAPLRTASQNAFARVVGVTRAEFARAHPHTDVAGLNWLAVVADEHRKAMRGDRNALLEAWLAAQQP